MKHLVAVAMTFTWVTGWVIANGFFSTLAAIFFPPWSWYLVAELLLNKFVL